MLFSDLTTARVLEVFTREIGIRGGQVTHNTFDDGSRLFARGVLCNLAEIQPGDQLRGGAAIKATKSGIWLYPYTFRLVCSNGAIHIHGLEERPVAKAERRTPEAVLQSVRKAIEDCCSEEVFSRTVAAMRKSIDINADDLYVLLGSLLSGVRSANHGDRPSSRLTRLMSLVRDRLPRADRRSAIRDRYPEDDDLFSAVRDRYRNDGDPSRFGLANAITAAAREVQDPDLKWELEKLGGEVATFRVPGRVNAGRLVADEADLVRTA